MSDAIRGITGHVSQLASYGQGPLAGLGGVGDGRGIQVPVGPSSGDAPSFGDTLKQFVNGVSDAQDASAELRGKFVRGEGVELHQVMAAGEEAGIALEMMVELRNKVTEAYRTLINMQ